MRTPNPIATGPVFPETRADRVEFAVIIWSFCVIVGICLGVFVVAAR